MPVQVGVGYIDIRPDMSGFGRDLKRDMSRDIALAGDAGGRSLGASLLGGFKASLGTIGVGLGAAAVVNFTKDAVAAASNLNEVTAKSAQVFRESSAEINAWAEAGAKDFGLSHRAALEAASGFGNMFAQLGIGLDSASAMSQSLVELAADLASFSNADITEVLIAQAAGFRGEYDSLQRFLPLINAATVEQKALELTGKKTNKELTAQEKALAVNALMFEGIGDAAGDFDRTSDSLANRTRTLNAELENASAKIGKQLTPVLAEVAGFLAETGIPAFFKLSEVIGEGLADAVGFGIGALADFLSVIAKALEKVDQFTPGLEGVPEDLQDVVDEMRSWEASAHGLEAGVDDVTGAVEAQTVAINKWDGAFADLAPVTLKAADAQRVLDKATRDLNGANRDRADAQEELNRLLEEGAVSEKAIAEARKASEQATRAAARADRQLSEAQERYDRALANATDLKGYDTAQDELADATINLADAQANATDAHESAAEAAQALRDAQAGDPDYQDKLADARDRVADATDAIVLAEKALTTAAEEAVAAHDAERVAIEQKTGALAEWNRIVDLAKQAAQPGGAATLGLDPNFIGPFSPQQLALTTEPDTTAGPLRTAGLGLDAAAAAVTATPVVTNNNVTVNVSGATTRPQQLAKEIVWALN